MSHFLSCKIADFLVYQQQISEEEWEIYQYHSVLQKISNRSQIC